MKVTLKNGNENVIDMELTIPAKDAVAAYERAVSNISQHVNIDGFRKGKAPRAIIEKHVGTERIKIEAIENLAPRNIAQAIDENKLDVITQPSITSFDFEYGKDLKLNVRVETRPDVTLGEYKGLNLKVEDSPIPADAQQKSIDNLLKQHASTETVTDRAAGNNDIAVIDFEGFADGEKIAGGEGKNYSLDLGNSNFIPGFAEQIVGKNAGDEFEINVNFPEEYHDEKLKGKPAVFKIKLHEIKERKLPELNDSFAQKVGPFKTVDDLKADIDKYLAEQRERTNKQNSENEIFKTVIEASSVEIPQSMIDREVESLKAEYKQRLSYQGIDWDALVKAQGEDHLAETLKTDAVNRIKNSLVIDKIAKTEDLKLEQKDIQQKFAQLAAMYGMQQQDIIKQLGHSPEMLGSISQQALSDKVRDFLVEHNTVEIVDKVETK